MDSRQYNEQDSYVKEIIIIHKFHENILKVLDKRIKRVKQEPDLFNRYAFLGILAENIGFREEAVKWYNQALFIKPDDIIQAKLDACYTKEESRKIDQVIDQPSNFLVDTYFQKLPEPSGGRFLAQLMNSINKDYDYADYGNDIKIAIKNTSPYRLDAIYTLGLHYHALKKYDEVADILDEIACSTYRMRSEEKQVGYKKYLKYQADTLLYSYAAAIAHTASAIESKNEYHRYHYFAYFRVKDFFAYYPRTDIFYLLRAKVQTISQEHKEAIDKFFLADYFQKFPLFSASDVSDIFEGNPEKIAKLKANHESITIDVIKNRVNQLADHGTCQLKEEYIKKLANQRLRLRNNGLFIYENSNKKLDEEVRSEMTYYFIKTNQSLTDYKKIQLLREIKPEFFKYGPAQFSLYELLINRNILQYNNLEDRQAAIYQGLEHLLHAAAAGHIKAQTEIRQYPLDYNTIDKKRIEKVAKKLWMAELKALPPTSSKFAKAQSLIHDHYLQIELNTHLQKNGLAKINQIKDVFYFIELTQEQLENQNNIRYIVGQKEVACLEFNNDAILLKSAGYRIHLRLKEGTAITHPVFKIYNPHGKVKLTADFSSQQGLKLQANVEQLHYFGYMHAKGPMEMESNGELFINVKDKQHLHRVSTDDQLSIKASSLTCGGILTSASLTNIIVKVFETDASFLVKSGADFTLVALNVKKLKGEIQCASNVLLHIKDKFYITRCEILAEGNTKISADTLMLARSAKISATGDIILDIKNKLIHSGKSISAFEKLAIRANIIENSADLMGDNIQLEINDLLLNHYLARIIARHQLVISGDGGMRNAGLIKFGSPSVISLDGFFVHGIANKDEIIKRVVEFNQIVENGPCIQGGDDGDIPITITTGALVTIAAFRKTPSYECTGLNINVGGVRIANHGSKTAVLNLLDFGLDIPNFSLIYRSLSGFLSTAMTDLQNKQYTKIANDAWNIINKDILTSRNLMTASAVTRSMVRRFAPKGVGTIVDTIWSSVMLLWNLDNIIAYCRELMKIENKKLRHFYPLLGFFSNMANLGVQMEGQITSLLEFDLDAEFKVNDQFSVDDILATVANVTSLALPSNVDTSLVDVFDAKFTLTGTATHQTLAGHSNNVTLAINAIDMSGVSDQENLVVAMNTITQGAYSQQNSLVVTKEAYTDVMHLAQKGKIITEHAGFSGQVLDMDAVITAGEAQFTATDDLQLKNTIHANTVQVQAPNVHVSNDVVTKHKLNIVTEKLDLQEQSSLTSHENMYVAAKTGDLSGHVETNQLHVKAEQVDANKLLKNQYPNVEVHKSLSVETVQDVQLSNESNFDIDLSVSAPHVEFVLDKNTSHKGIETSHNLSVMTQDDLNVNVEVTANDVNFKSEQGGINTHNTITAGNTLSMMSKEDIHTGKLSGNNVFLDSQFGNIYVTNKILSLHDLVVIAENGSVSLICQEWTVRGLYDWMKVWHPAEMLAGGDLYIFANYAVKIDASVVSAVGDVNISGEKEGVSMTPRDHTYISYESSHTTWYGKKDEKIYKSVQEVNPVITAGGEINIQSLAGKIYSLATQFQSKLGIKVYGELGVSFKGLIAQTSSYHLHENWFGLTSDKINKIDDISIPTYVITDLGVSIVSKEGDVQLIDTSILAKKLEIMGVNIDISTTTLNHTIHASSRSFGFNYPLLEKFNRYIKGDFSAWSSLMQDLNTFSYTQDIAALGLNVWNAAIEGVNVTNRVLTSLREGNLLSLLDLDPTAIRVSYTETHMTTHYQTLAPVFIQAGELKLTAKEEIKLENGIPIKAENADITARKLRESGAKLVTTVASEVTSLGMNASCMQVDFDVSHTETVTRATHIVPQELQVANELKIKVDTLEKHNATESASKVEKDVKHEFSVTEEDTSETRQTSVHISTAGSFGISDSMEKSIGTKTKSNIYSLNGSLFFNRDLEKLRDNLAWAAKQQIQPTVVEEFQIDQIEKRAQDQVMLEEVESVAVHGHQQEDNKNVEQNDASLSEVTLCEMDCWMQQKWDDITFDPECVITFDSAGISKPSGQKILSCFKLTSEMWASLSKSCVGVHLNGMIEKIVDVERYCEIYNESLEQGKTHKEAMGELSKEAIKDFLSHESLMIFASHYGLRPYPLYALQTFLVIIHYNCQEIERQLMTAQALAPTKESVENAPFLAKFSIYHNQAAIKDRLDFNHALDNIGKLLI